MSLLLDNHNLMVEAVMNISQAGKPVVLVGCGVPEQFNECLSIDETVKAVRESIQRCL